MIIANSNNYFQINQKLIYYAFIGITILLIVL